MSNFNRIFGPLNSPVPMSYLDDNFSQLEAASTSTVSITGAGLIGFLPSGTGAAPRTMQSKERDWVSVLDFYANGVSGVTVDPTGVVDSTGGIQAAINSVAGGGRVYFPAGTYLVTSVLTVGSGIILFGLGQAGSPTIKFRPTAAATLLKFTSGGATTVSQSGIFGLRLVATGETSFVKKAIVVIDGEEIELGHISIANWSDATKASVGFELQGRQTLSCHDITVNADQPFNLKISPNTSVVACDHFHFWNIYAIADTTQPVFLIDNGVWLTNCTWDGYQAWVQGTYGLYWNAAGAATRSYNVRIQNIRWEQSTNATGYALYLVPKTFSTALNIENVFTDANHRGYYIRNFVNGELKGSMFGGSSGVALDVDSSTTITIKDNFFSLNAGATINSTGFVGAWINNDSATSNTSDGKLLTNSITTRGQFLGNGSAGAPAFARTTAGDMGMNFDNSGPYLVVGGIAIAQAQSGGWMPIGHNTFDFGSSGNAWKNLYLAGLLSIASGGSTSISTGVGSIKMSSANAAMNTAWIPITYAGNTYFIPAWTTNSP